MDNLTPVQILSRLNAEPLLVSPQHAQAVCDMIMAAPHASAGLPAEKPVLAQVVSYASVFGFSANQPEKPFAFADGIAIIPITGALINRYDWSGYGYTGYQSIERKLEAALADPDVKGIVFDVNSFGGEVQGCFELAESIFASRGTKPSRAVVNANAYSAGYALASSASKMVVTPSGGAGSVGVVTMHMDVSKLMSEWGIKITHIYAGKHKVDGSPYAPLPDEVRAGIQARIDTTYDRFTALVSRNKGLDVEKVRGTEAQIYSAADALALGLIDAVMTPKEAFAAFRNELSGSTSLLGVTMSTAQATTGAAAEAAPATAATAPAAAAPAASTVNASAERERIKGILTCEAATGRSDLANHLAYDTDMSVEDAKAILAKAPAATQAAAASESPFEAAMAATPNPQVGTEGAASTSQLSGGDQIIASARAAGVMMVDTGKK